MFSKIYNAPAELLSSLLNLLLCAVHVAVTVVGLAEAAERFETWGGGEGSSSYTKPSTYPYSHFPKCPLRSSFAQANLFAILTVSSVSVIDL